MPGTVLLVDDDPNLLQGLSRVLRREPYRVLLAKSGCEALDIVRAMKIQVVVADQGMPGMSGVELLARVRLDSPETMRLMLSGITDFEIAQKAINEGEIFRFFTKPCNEIELAMSIRQALAHGELICELRRIHASTHRHQRFTAVLD